MPTNRVQNSVIFKDYQTKDVPMSIHKANQYIKKRQSFYSAMNRPVPSARELIQALGYDEAQKMGILKAYKDAWGINFGRPKDFWDKNWSHIIKNTT